MRSLFLLILLLALTSRLAAGEIQQVMIAGKPAQVCRVDLRKERLRLFLRDEHGRTFKSFHAIEQWLAPRGEKLVFGMNGGMYHPDYSPVGVYIENGRTIAPLNLAAGEGNFFLKPNGVFYVAASGAQVVEASAFAKVTAPVSLASQSGPMLVLDGKLHPAFHAGSTSRLARNGVGVADDPFTAIFVITVEPVNFHEFASYFRDELHCPNALFLDGTVSSLHAPELKRSDKLIDLGPIFGVVEKATASEVK